MYVIILMFIGSFIFCYLLSKLSNTAQARQKIMYAIDAYVTEFDCPLKGLELLWQMEDFDKTLFRLWDWGYKNILPKEDFELIKPYIEEK